MARMVVVRNKDNTVSALPLSRHVSDYERRYEVLAVVNRGWSPRNVVAIKRYYGMDVRL